LTQTLNPRPLTLNPKQHSKAGAEQDAAASGAGGGSKYGLDDAMRNARLFYFEVNPEFRV